MKLISLLLTLVLISGCSLPPALQLASYAVSGISYLATGKSMSDHVISTAMAKDCALHRVVFDEPICIEGDDEFAVAAAPQPFPGGSEQSNGQTPARELKEALIALAEQIDEPAKPTNVEFEKLDLQTAALDAVAATLNDLEPAAGAPSTAGQRTSDQYVLVGKYKDIRNANKARKLAGPHQTKIRMIVAEGELWHRVTVGPMKEVAANKTMTVLAQSGDWRVENMCTDCDLTVAAR